MNRTFALAVSALLLLAAPAWAGTLQYFEDSLGSPGVTALYAPGSGLVADIDYDAELRRGRQPALRRERDHDPSARRRGAGRVRVPARGGLHRRRGLRVHGRRRGHGLARGERLGHRPADGSARARRHHLGQPGGGQPVPGELQLHGRERDRAGNAVRSRSRRRFRSPRRACSLGLALAAFGVARRRMRRAG